MFGDVREKNSYQVVPTHNFCVQGHNQDRAGYVIRVSNSGDLDELADCDHDLLEGDPRSDRTPSDLHPDTKLVPRLSCYNIP